MKYLSIPVLALISMISKDQVCAINMRANIGNGLDLMEQTNQGVDAYSEAERYIGSDGKPIILSQTSGHARIVLSKTKKYDQPQPIEVMNLQLDMCKGTAHKAEATVELDDVTHCPINNDGHPVQARIQQINLEDNAYVSEMYVGNPPQKIRGLFDTGSTNMWVLNKNVQLPNGADKQYAYDPAASSTFKNGTQKAAIQFGSGALAGNFVNDDVRLGSCDGQTSNGQIHIKNQRFGNVQRQRTIFTGSNFEAIVGLAYPTLAEKGVTPIFDEMMNQHLLTQNLFAFYLTSKQADNQGVHSDLTFGYYDKAKFTGEMKWYPIQFQYMFGVPLDDIKVNGKSTGVCANRPNGCLITFDSGTSLMSVPTFASKILMQHQVPTANFVMPCQNQAQFGDLTLVIGGDEYTLSNEEWMFPSEQIKFAQGGQTLNFKMGPLGPQVMAQIDSGEHVFEQFGNETLTMIDSQQTESVDKKHATMPKQACMSTIMTMDIAREMFLVGDVFMRKFYTVFDRDNNRVGLAKSVTNDRVAAL